MFYEGEIVGWKIDDGDRVWVLERVKVRVVMLDVIIHTIQPCDPDMPWEAPKFQDTFEWTTRWRPATREEIENDPRLTGG